MRDPNKTSTVSNKFSATGSKILVRVHTSESSTESLETLGFCLWGMVWCANKHFHSENSLEQLSVHTHPSDRAMATSVEAGTVVVPPAIMPMTAQAPLQLHSPYCQSLYQFRGQQNILAQTS